MISSEVFGKVVVEKKWLALLLGILFTFLWVMGLSGLSMNPDNRIFFF